MAASTRALAMLSLFTAVLGGLQTVYPGWADNLLTGRSPFVPMARELSPVGPEHEAVFRRLEERRKVIERLRAGELTLLQAAAAFEVLNATPAEHPFTGMHLLAGKCPGEKHCRQVLSWAAVVLRGRTSEDELDRLLLRWESELVNHLARHGTVVLPPIPAGQARK